MQFRATVWHVLAAVLAVMFALLGASPSAAATPAFTYDTPAYTYDVPALLSSPDTVATYERGSPSRPEVASWDAPVFVGGGCCTAAKTVAKSCSFSGATTVLMSDGTCKPIEDIEVGDRVIATDPETGERAAKKVTHVWVHEDTVVDLVVDGAVITTTADHPFWSVTDQRFERAEQLEHGENAFGADGEKLTVSGLKPGTERESLAYNLSIEGIHTYHVGQSEVLVHNDCGLLLLSRTQGARMTTRRRTGPRTPSTR